MKRRLFLKNMCASGAIMPSAYLLAHTAPVYADNAPTKTQSRRRLR